MIAKIVFLVCLLLLPTQGWAVVTDPFTGADGTALPTYSANWANPNSGTFNNLLIKTNTVGGAFLGAAIYTGASFADNQYAQAVVQNTPTDQMLVMVRWTNGAANSGYGGGVINAATDLKYKIWKRADASLLAVTAAQTMQIGDVVRISAVGSTITLTVNGVDILTATDGADTSGYPGLYTYDSPTSGPMWDSFEAGDIGGTSSSLLLMGVGQR